MAKAMAGAAIVGIGGAETMQVDTRSASHGMAAGKSMTSKDRMSVMSDKLGVLTNGLDQDRSARFEHVQDKLRLLDDRVGASQDHTSKKFMVLKEQVITFQKELSTEQQSREKLVSAKEGEIKQIGASLRTSLVAEQEERRASEQRILDHFEQKTQSMKDEVNECGKTRMRNEANLRRYLEVDIPKLYESLKEEIDNREAMEQRMLSKAMDEVTLLQSAILSEKQAREESEEAMLRMMEDVVAKMQAEIAAERAERERTENMLMGVLHDTCSRMQLACGADM